MKRPRRSRRGLSRIRLRERLWVDVEARRCEGLPLAVRVHVEPSGALGFTGGPLRRVETEGSIAQSSVEEARPSFGYEDAVLEAREVHIWVEVASVDTLNVTKSP